MHICCVPVDLHRMLYGNYSDYFDFCIFFLDCLGGGGGGRGSESLCKLVAWVRDAVMAFSLR